MFGLTWIDDQKVVKILWDILPLGSAWLLIYMDMGLSTIGLCIVDLGLEWWFNPLAFGMPYSQTQINSMCPFSGELHHFFRIKSSRKPKTRRSDRSFHFAGGAGQLDISHHFTMMDLDLVKLRGWQVPYFFVVPVEYTSPKKGKLMVLRESKGITIGSVVWPSLIFFETSIQLL